VWRRMKSRIPFGPVPSRRLKRSLGINHIPPKICNYSCAYCQIGKTLKLTNKRQSFYDPEEIKRQVEKKVKELKERKERIDFLSFVPDGEPLLDINLGREIDLLKELGIPIAVISNGTFLTSRKEREELSKADWVSLKIDAVNGKTWKRVNRPHPDIILKDVLDGMIKFSAEYMGELNTETLLIDKINDNEEEIKDIADFIGQINPDKAYIAVPTRPPQFEWVKASEEKVINTAYNIFKEIIENVELLLGYARSQFAKSINIKNDILDITAVHPMTEDDLKELLRKSNEDWEVITQLIEEGELIMVEYRNKRFFMRALESRRK
jgi:wyosine [tRNA(Phe)-imidazoG37] synthetase (radical SAM superfamily)